MLLDALREEGGSGRSLLDIGGGIGAVQHAFLAEGAPSVVNVDAAPAYQEAVRAEAKRTGSEARIEFFLGDFVEVAPALPSADVVTLDRVICCYPDMEALVGASAARANALWGAVFPREHVLARLGMAVVNVLQRVRGRAFRVYVHPAAAVAAVLEREGFGRCSTRTTPLWQVTVWRRGRPAPPRAQSAETSTAPP